MSGTRNVMLALLLTVAAATSTHGQELRSAVVPASITVGDVFHAVLRAEGPDAARTVFPDTLALPPDLERAGRRRLVRDTVDGAERWTALYPLTGWRPGEHVLPDPAVQLGGPAAPRLARARFPLVSIASVLPADTAGIEPQPPHDVLGANRVWWPWLLGGLLLIALLAGLLWWRRRRRRAAPAPLLAPVSVDPRTAALAALQRARAAGTLEQGAFRRFYSDVSEALRGYVAAVDPGFGPDLTTRELAGRMRSAGREATGRELIAVLAAADLVKFARRRTDAAAALADWERARRFVESFDVDGSGERRAA
jgi:hypothetical protein